MCSYTGGHASRWYYGLNLGGVCMLSHCLFFSADRLADSHNLFSSFGSRWREEEHGPGGAGLGC